MSLNRLAYFWIWRAYLEGYTLLALAWKTDPGTFGSIALTSRINPDLSRSPLPAKWMRCSWPCKYFISIFFLTNSNLLSSRCFSRKTSNYSLYLITLNGLSPDSKSSSLRDLIAGSCIIFVKSTPSLLLRWLTTFLLVPPCVWNWFRLNGWSPLSGPEARKPPVSLF